MPRKDLVEAWRDIEHHAKELAKRLTGKEAATPSAHLEAAVRSSSGDDSVPRGDRASAGGTAEDQEFLHQVAASAAEDSAAGDDGTAHNSAVADLPEDRARRLHAAAGWQAAFAHRDVEVLEAACSTTASTTAATEAWTWGEGCGCCAGPGSRCRQEEREGRSSCASRSRNRSGQGCESCASTTCCREGRRPAKAASAKPAPKAAPKPASKPAHKPAPKPAKAAAKKKKKR